MAPALQVISRWTTDIQRGYGDHNEFTSQVTKVRLDDAVGYVRENRAASSLDHFCLSSGARLGDKADGNRIGQQVLELAAPPSSWDALAAAVAELDELRRPVVRHQRWTMKTAARTEPPGVRP